MHEFIKNRLKDIGRTQKELADYIGIQPPHLSAIFKGIRKIQSNEILPISKFLDIDIATLTKMIAGEKLELSPPSSTCTIYKVGYVQAGKWNEACQLPEDEWESIPYPINDDYKNKRLFALGVKGDSMNKVFPADRTTLICCPIENWGKEPENGDYVIVYQKGETEKCESTVKRFYKISDDEYILRPESTNGTFFDIKLTKNDYEYKIHAIVIDYMTKLKELQHR